MATGEPEAAMTLRKELLIEMSLHEDADSTRADAIVRIGDRVFRGYGRARRNPKDPDVPRIGEELATARALADLSHQLVHAAADNIEAIEGHEVTLSS
jgi:hypothetical protein